MATVKIIFQIVKALAPFILAAVVYIQFQTIGTLKETLKTEQSNVKQLIEQDSTQYAEIILQKREFRKYITEQNTRIDSILKANKVNPRRVERIITHHNTYRDTVSTVSHLDSILYSIQERKPVKTPILDETECLIIKGYVEYDGETLDLNITDRQFKNTTDVITYMQRRKWRFLFFKTRLFGRKEIKVTIVNKCGESKVFVVNKRGEILK